MIEPNVIQDYLDQDPSNLSFKALQIASKELGMPVTAVRSLGKKIGKGWDNIGVDDIQPFISPTPAPAPVLATAGYSPDPAISESHHRDSVAHNLAHGIRHLEEAQKSADNLNDEAKNDPEVSKALSLLEQNKQRVRDILQQSIKRVEGENEGEGEFSLLIDTMDEFITLGSQKEDLPGGNVDRLIYHLEHGSRHLDKAENHSQKMRSELDESSVDVENERLSDLENKIRDAIEEKGSKTAVDFGLSGQADGSESVGDASDNNPLKSWRARKNVDTGAQGSPGVGASEHYSGGYGVPSGGPGMEISSPAVSKTERDIRKVKRGSGLNFRNWLEGRGSNGKDKE